MSEWKKCPIGEVVTLRQGFAINAKSKHYMSKEETSLPLLRIADMKNGTKEVFVKEEIPQRFIAHPEDIIYTRTGNVGLVFRNNYGVMHNNCFSVTPNDADELSRDFLYYALQNKTFFDTANALARGAAQPDLPHTSFNSIEFAYPSLFVQERIAYILSRYDSLIENYQKQIKLLEEAAQRLYKEWFIDLHFPGHENTNIVDGVPVGWEKKKISDVCTMIGAGSTPSRRNNAYWDDGNIRWVKTKELLDNWIFDTEEYITEEGLNNSSTKMFPVNTILMAIYASPTLGRLGILAQECCCNQAALGLVANEKLISWVWLYLKLFELRDEFNAVARGAGQQNISGVVVKNWEITVPNKKTIEDFAKMAKPYFENAKSLQSQLRLLTEARDRLLPKLMSGELTLEARAEKEDLLATPCKGGDEAK